MTEPLEAAHLDISSWHGKTASAPIKTYDLALCFIGWESRCLESTKLPNPRFAKSILVRWMEAAGELTFQRGSRDLSVFLKQHSSETPEILDFSMVAQLDVTLDAIMARVVAISKRVGRPIDMFIDISNCPEFFTMGLLALSTSLGLVSSICFFYSEAEYPSGPGKVSFTEGLWNVRPVPLLQYPVDPKLSTTMVLGLGFEGDKARRMILHYEPERLFALLPTPGFTSEYTRRAKLENSSVLRDIERSNREMVLTASAGDGLAALLALRGSMISDTRSNLLLIPTGPKPHAIAMALYALTRGRCTVLYRNPEKYEVKESRGTGVCWILNVRDRTALLPRFQRTAAVISA